MPSESPVSSTQSPTSHSLAESLQASWIVHRDHLEELATAIMTRLEENLEYPIHDAVDDLDRVWAALVHHHQWLEEVSHLRETSPRDPATPPTTPEVPQ